jgi:hypothetical protein
MKKDIPILRVENIAIAVVPGDDDELWNTYIINEKEESISNVLINSKGYGELNGDIVKTSVLRHFFEEIQPFSALMIEPIQTKLFDITNEYWVSFTLDNYMYDKKYVFVQGSISRENFTTIPFLGKKGVMIR